MNMFFHFIFLASEPYTEYRVIVIAFTLKYDGEPSDPVIQRTDIAGPSAPQIINLTCHSQDALYLQWKRPTTFYNSIDFYVINYKESSYSNFQQIQLNTTAAFAETAVCEHSTLCAFKLRLL
jgi:receptor-type tyrosine-protein phosphatase gamma